jgi:hypothetical protein
MQLDITFPGSRQKTKKSDQPPTLASVEEEIKHARARVSRVALVLLSASARQRRVARLNGLLRLRYTLLPVGRLPLELLSTVLEAARLVCEPWHAWLKTLLGLSHVCGAWRQTAHALPNLWSSLNFRYPRLSRYSLDREPTVPLDVFCPYVRSSHLLQGVLLLMHRSRAVELVFDPEQAYILEDRFTQTYAPHLRSLTLVAEQDSPLIEFNPSFNLPGREAVPNLKVLRLDCAEIGWASLHTLHIRVLSLRNLNFLTRDILHELLSHLHQLDALELSNVLWSLAPDASPTITLPRLSILRVKDYVENLPMFLLSFQWRDSTRIHLINMDTSFTAQAVSVLAELINRRLNAAQKLPLHTLSVHQGHHSLTLRVWPGDVPLRSPPLYEVELHSESEQDPRLGADAMIQHLGPHTRRLRIVGQSEHHAPDELISGASLAALGDLRSFTAVGVDTSAVIAVLRGHHTSLDAYQLPWPALECLDVSGCMYVPEDTALLQQTLRAREAITGRRLAVLCVRADDEMADDVADVVRREQRLGDLDREFGLQRLMDELVAGKRCNDELLVTAEPIYAFTVQMLLRVSGEVVLLGVLMCSRRHVV